MTLGAPTSTVVADDVAKPHRIVFHRLIPTARMPQRADRSAAGTLPTRAFRYCEPVVTASAFGYYVFPPFNFSLMWDGLEISWTYPDADGWLPLKTAQFPHFAAYFDERAPEEIRGFSPPFLGAFQEPGLLQMWSGLVARTAPGWSLLVRPCANLPRHGGYELYEGIIETDRWFGPLITNLRLTKTGVPIEFRADFPLLQVQPLPREVLDEAGQNDYEIVPTMEQLSPEDWDDFYDTVVRPNVMEKRPRGQYAAAARKRRKGEGGEQAE
jgi:Family of unknown function (DUF6065)